MHDKLKNIDKKELELPETVYIRDIEGRVFQSLALQCLSKIEGVYFLEGNLIDNFLGRDAAERVKGIYVDQDQKNKSVSIKVEVNVKYGIALPEKAQEIQNKISAEITSLTGLHVSCVHVVFKNIIAKETLEEQLEKLPSLEKQPPVLLAQEEEED